MNVELVVTTVYDPVPEVLINARHWAEQLQAVYMPRGKKSLQALQNVSPSGIILVASLEGPIVYTPGGRYFFHLSMAELRIKHLVNGKHDHMVAAMGLGPGMSVLDCTLGLASDAIVASYVVGEAGSVTGLEHSPVLALVAEQGLSRFVAENPEVTNALRRITVKQFHHADYLRQLPDQSYDVVFFDPMFRSPVESSSNIKPIRYLADPRPISPETLQEGIRVARRRVVLKEAHGSPIFQELGFSRLEGGKYSSVQYGVREVRLEERPDDSNRRSDGGWQNQA